MFFHLPLVTGCTLFPILKFVIQFYLDIQLKHSQYFTLLIFVVLTHKNIIENLVSTENNPDIILGLKSASPADDKRARLCVCMRGVRRRTVGVPALCFLPRRSSTVNSLYYDPSSVWDLWTDRCASLSIRILPHRTNAGGESATGLTAYSNAVSSQHTAGAQGHSVSPSECVCVCALVI